MQFSVLLISLALATPEAPFNPFDALTLKSTHDGPQYETCIQNIEQDPEAGQRAAQTWVHDSGGIAAMHCHAIAYMANDHPKLAALRLLEIAQRPDAGDPLVRARYLEQAAQAWLEADMPEFALEAINQALNIAPNAGELSLMAGLIYAADEQWQRTIDAINAAQDQDIISPEAFIARGRANKALLHHLEAAKDVVSALALDPFNLDALVLRGELQQIGVEINAKYHRAPEQ